MATPRKAPATKRATPRRPAPVEPTPGRIDLGAILGVDAGPPTPVTLFGVDAEVRRTFTGQEAVQFFALVNANRYDEMLDLVTDNGAALWAQIAPLAPAHAAKVLNQIVEVTGLHEGKLLAPLLPSAGNAGAQPSPASGTTTA